MYHYGHIHMDIHEFIEFGDIVTLRKKNQPLFQINIFEIKWSLTLKKNNNSH